MSTQEEARNALVVGKWVLAEKYFHGRFSRPKLITKVTASRVYFKEPFRNHKTKEIEDWKEGFCNQSSVLYVVDTEEQGLAAHEEQSRLDKIYTEECAAALRRFRSGVSSFIAAQKAVA